MKIPHHFFFVALGSWENIAHKGLFFAHNSKEYRKLDRYSKTLIQNGEQTVLLNNGTLQNAPSYTVFNDASCKRIIHAYDSADSNTLKLHDVYVKTVDLRYKSDICRLVVLEKFGGFYSDLDQKPVNGFVSLLPSNAGMVVVMTDERKKRFTHTVHVNIHSRGVRLANGLLGFAPNHFFVRKCLTEIRREYKLDQTFSRGLGPQLMSRMILKHAETFEEHSVHVFVESQNVKGDPNHSPVSMQKGGINCNFIMFDQITKQVIFYTRVKVKGFSC